MNRGGANGRLTEYTVFDRNVISFGSGSFYTYDPASFDTAVLDEITAARPEPERSEADIESAGAAFRAIAEEAAPGCTLDVSYDAGTDAYWSDVALHDSFLMPAESKTGADFIALSFTCSPAEGGEPLWAVEPGKEAVVVLMRGEDGWEYMNWTQA